MAVHAAVEYATTWTIETPIVAVLAVSNEYRLLGLAEELELNHNVARFYEPDLDGELASIATIANARTLALQRLPLLFNREGVRK
jgi:hypothetical protein